MAAMRTFRSSLTRLTSRNASRFAGTAGRPEDRLKADRRNPRPPLETQNLGAFRRLIILRFCSPALLFGGLLNLADVIGLIGQKIGQARERDHTAECGQRRPTGGGSACDCRRLVADRCLRSARSIFPARRIAPGQPDVSESQPLHAIKDNERLLVRNWKLNRRTFGWRCRHRLERRRPFGSVRPIEPRHRHRPRRESQHGRHVVSQPTATVPFILRRRGRPRLSVHPETRTAPPARLSPVRPQTRVLFEICRDCPRSPCGRANPNPAPVRKHAAVAPNGPASARSGHPIPSTFIGRMAWKRRQQLLRGWSPSAARAASP